MWKPCVQIGTEKRIRSPLSHSLYYYDGNYMWKPCVQIGTEKRIRSPLSHSTYCTFHFIYLRLSLHIDEKLSN